jgi:hypothetical protein
MILSTREVFASISVACTVPILRMLTAAWPTSTRAAGIVVHGINYVYRAATGNDMFGL